jgi:hypothetical protein
MYEKPSGLQLADLESGYRAKLRQLRATIAEQLQTPRRLSSQPCTGALIADFTGKAAEKITNDETFVPGSMLEAMQRGQQADDQALEIAALKAEREDLERRAAAGDEHRRRAEEAEAKRLELAARVAELEQLEGDLAELKELRAAKDLAQPAADAAPQREPGEGGAEPAATVDDQIAAKRLELAAFLAGHDPQAAFKVCDPGRLLQPFEQSQLTPRAAPLKPSDAAPTRCSTKTPTASSRPRSCGTS